MNRHFYIRPALGAEQIGSISQLEIQTFYTGMFERGLSVRTIEYTFAVLRSAFGLAVRWKMLGESPCVGVDVLRGKRKEIEVLSVEESRKFLSVARNWRWYALFALALATGMRPREYLALKWSDTDWQRGTVASPEPFR